MKYINYGNERNVSALIGKTLIEIRGADQDELHFITSAGEEYVMTHQQECCESVNLADVIGDLNDLIESPILQAEEVSNNDLIPSGYVEGDHDLSESWTFYRFATIKGTVVLRWFGSSNGFYSEGVDFGLVS